MAKYNRSNTARTQHIFFISLCLILLISCKNNAKKQETENRVLNLKESIILEKLPVATPLEATLTIPLEFTEKSILAEVSIEGISKKYIVTQDVSKLCFFDKKGTFLSSISRKGSGPEEYTDISGCCWIDFNKEEVHLHDLHKKTIKKYDFSGNFIEQKPSVHLLTFTELNPDEFIACNEVSSDFKFTIYDKKWKAKDSIFAKEKTSTKDFIVLKDFQKNSKGVFFYDNSILYECKSKEMQPMLFLEKGNLKIPSEVEYDITRKKERHEYIWGDFVMLADDYLFVNFYYDYKKYYDIWSVKNQKLLYRNTISFPDDSSGIPILVNGKEVNGWIKYFKNNMFYFMISEQTRGELEINNQENPIIVGISLESFEKILN